MVSAGGNDRLPLFPETIDAEPQGVAKPEKAAASDADALRRAGADHVAGQERHEGAPDNSRRRRSSARCFLGLVLGRGRSGAAL